MQIDSFCQPLRDAITAKAKYGYKHPLVDEALFAQHHADLVVRAGEGFVFVGTREATQARKAVNVGILAPNTPVEIEVLVDPLFLESVCLQLHKLAFSPQPNFVVFNTPPEQITDLESRYDVAFAPHENQPSKHSLVGPLNLKTK